MAWTFRVVHGPPENQLVAPVPPNQALLMVSLAPVIYTGVVLVVVAPKVYESHTNRGTLGAAANVIVAVLSWAVVQVVKDMLGESEKVT